MRDFLNWLETGGWVVGTLTAIVLIGYLIELIKKPFKNRKKRRK